MINPRGASSWTKEEWAELRRDINVYKHWIRPLLPTCRVHHIMPRPDGEHWDGIFYYEADMGKGMVFVFRPNTDVTSHTIPLKGLDPQAKYRLWFEDGTNPEVTRSGQDLMGRGIEVRLDEGPYTSELIYVQVDEEWLSL